MRTDSLRLPALPDAIGRYEVVSLLGEGGMARVYLAMQRGPFAATKLVAIKHLRAEVSHDDQFLNMFVDEARIALRLNHPNVVHTYEVVAEENEYYLLMEFLEGQTLMNLLRYAGRESIPLSDQLWVLTQVLAGLQYAHELRDFDGTRLNIVHRDVSPSNVFVTYAGEIKLLDFGIAKAAGAISATQQGIMKGKLGYAAPEQCLGRQVDNRTDVFAVGVMLWEAMAKKRRWSGETQQAMMQARITHTEPAIEEVWPEVPMPLAAISRRALAQDPEERYASAAEFQADLDQYLRSMPRPPGPENIAKLMAEVFQEEREELRRIIEERIGSTRYTLPTGSQAAPASLPPRSIGARALHGNPAESRRASSRPGPATDGSGERDEKSGLSEANQNSLSGLKTGWLASIAAADATPKRRALFIGLSCGGVLALLAAIWVGMRGESPQVPAGTVTPLATLPLASASSSLTGGSPMPNATVAGAGVSAPLVAPVQLIKARISVTPPWATVHLDGKRLEGLPTETVLPRDGKDHILTAGANGYESLERTLSFDRDFSLEVALRPAQAFRGGFVKKKKEEPVTSFAVPAAAAPAPSAGRGDRSEPGQDLRPTVGNRSLRGIDESDPYR
ncbi:MAG TPA: serine/threonine-protein kinase [Polyangiaceae bacterium]|nr:serine/threonine-protein kinase [Polyangiaceae bacterium]